MLCFIAIENTYNGVGGCVVFMENVYAIIVLGCFKGLALYLDGV